MSDNTHNHHDKGYKALFSEPQMVEDLLRGFVKEEWVEAMDFSTLEPTNKSFVDDSMNERHDDIIWKLRFQDTWLYLYLLIEFQSKPDYYMAVRIMSYVALLYQDIIKGPDFEKDRPLPPVMPLVIYNGARGARNEAYLEYVAVTSDSGQRRR
ncbi:Rpn family recombination-promoting nuclease/putative transposase [Desulfurispira natronophila]|uniref:Putative transposase/invertase (TIGR01784 family) n=1 Tax=Desulfurispira natronophila TaxID=682562 RepID=A0A7W7Y4M3_9BACT|nr:Rpn family recombination-promoting nuclease/putative transposase [Desulfurispira natronophila]MBB5021949.1 putative transposase/invertase (TIGR01784 family) [Desulfurispira natronophila]